VREKQKSDTYCLGVVVDDEVVEVVVCVVEVVEVFVCVVEVDEVLVSVVVVTVVVGTKPRMRLESFKIHSSNASGKLS